MSIGFNPWNLIRSLKSADEWGESINSNIIGSTRNAYKSSEMMFGGGLTRTLKPFANNKAGIMVAETQVDVGYTRINWKQGQIQQTGLQTDFSINGKGFFIVAEAKTTNWGASPLYFNGTGVNANKGYLTKDGNFHFAIVTNPAGVNVAVASGISANASEPVLVNNEGLVVLGDYLGTSDNWMAPITKTDFDALTGARARTRPSIVEPTLDDPTNVATRAGQPISIVEYNDLQFSKYGSTIYEAPKSTMYKTIVNGSNGVLDRREPADLMDRQSRLIEEALEGSNVNLEEEIVGLSASKSFYEALTKNFSVYLDNIDSSLRLFR